jgi:hypothetical protein
MTAAVSPCQLEDVATVRTTSCWAEKEKKVALLSQGWEGWGAADE